MGAILEDLKDQVGLVYPGENLSMGMHYQSINALACINPSMRASLIELETNNLKLDGSLH